MYEFYDTEEWSIPRKIFCSRLNRLEHGQYILNKETFETKAEVTSFLIELLP